MKRISDYIGESLFTQHIHSDYRTHKYTVKPANKQELANIIINRINSNGDKCDLNDINVSEITDMSGLFMRSDFRGDISQWDTQNVEDMSNMFQGSLFNGDISKWETNKVKTMNGMFKDSEFTGKKGDISNWVTVNLENIGNIFSGSKFAGNIENWNHDKIKEVTGAFNDCPADVPDWIYDIMWN